MTPFSERFTLSTSSACCSIDFILCETYSRVVPFDSIFCIRSEHFFLKRTSPTERISSAISISGCTDVAIEKPSLAFIPDEKFFTGESRKS